jgi:DNA-binding NtrC family response regulator
MAGSGDAMARLRLQLRRVGPHFRTVLLRGEPGTGKELAARTLHRMSPAANGPFVVCSAATLDEAVTAQPGHDSAAAEPMEHAVKMALGGTLFLDEIGNMPMEAQTQLLRVMRLQEWGQRGLAAPPQKMDLRVIASTADDLRILASAGRFRQELYRQISMVEITVPPLRERREDIPELAAGLLTRLARKNGRQPSQISDEALKRLQAYRWPGNVRELESVLLDAALRCEGAVLEADHLPELPDDAPSAAENGMTRLQDVVEQHVLHVLKSCGGNKLRAAEVLGISRSTLYRMLESSATSAG